jgi:hypothetical protein
MRIYKFLPAATRPHPRAYRRSIDLIYLTIFTKTSFPVQRAADAQSLTETERAIVTAILTLTEHLDGSEWRTPGYVNT